MRGALYSAVVTGLRRGSIGQPSIEDVEQRDTALQLAGETTRGSVKEQLYRDLAHSAEMWIERSIAEDDVPSDGRHW